MAADEFSDDPDAATTSARTETVRLANLERAGFRVTEDRLVRR
jgi:hypothetical protein